MRAPRKRQRSPVSLEILEQQESSARMQRLEETRQRNEAAQKLPIGKKRVKRRGSARLDHDALDADAECKLPGLGLDK